MRLPSLWERRTDPEPFGALQQEIDHLFDNFKSGWPSATEWLDERHFVPRLDVSETDGEVRVQAELPGMDEKDVEVSVTDDLLTISGEKKTEKEEQKENYYMKECSTGSFSRSIRLPFEADSNKVKAVFKKGMLTVTLPKPEEVKQRTKRITVKTEG